MKDLDFTFPILKDEWKTRELHVAKCKKIKGVKIELPSINETVNDTFISHQFAFQHIKFNKQKGLRALKTRVNGTMYNYLQSEIERLGLPKSYVTALYLNNFDDINKIMEEASKEIYEALNDE